ncbi:Asp-tRNA(Asn)/Glu-tRNA(Gln) amidotransferase GatCAB subunit B [Candidatus Saccharibacteria bacterium]|nr:MAG: Asp-tRNA(Asn)/Glu-tRNA(Gln) amidotransferase GatCAB subunit B [Candidatus Saccharibacteria bacterium]
MISDDIRRQYTATIGIECHVQFKTKTKLFSGADNDAREAAPNTLVNHIDFGLPGALPVLNEKAVELASRAAFVLGTEPQRFSKFDRKHYFYPDLPMGYQITQFYDPIIKDGSVSVVVNGETKVVRIHEAHMEADAGKSTHPAGADYSLVDLNRAGTPLLEIVSEPDMHSAAEAKAYARELWLGMRYADVSEANLYYGNMRFDVNVSVSKTNELGKRTETKNLNSFRSVERAIEYEIARQIELLEAGQTVVQETRGWDDDGQKTFSQRSKEDSYEYRYMPDPDIPPIVLSDEYVAEIAASMPELPDAYRKKGAAMGLDAKTVEDIVAQPEVARQVGRVYDDAGADHAKRVAFWLMRPLAEDSEHAAGLGEQPAHESQSADATQSSGPADQKARDDGGVADEHLIALSQMVADGKLSSTAAKEVLDTMFKTGEHPEKIAEAKNLLQLSDESAIADIVQQVLADNPKAAGDVQNGEMKAIGFLVGQVMKVSQGKANPGLATQLIKKQLGIQ